MKLSESISSERDWLQPLVSNSAKKWFCCGGPANWADEMPSEKTKIIEQIFNAKWNQTTGEIQNSIVTLHDVQQAIERYRRANPRTQLSARNPANFFKDLTRKRANANLNWPATVFARGYTARQITGGGKWFEFIRRTVSQTEPFPVSVPSPTESTPIHRITSTVLPVASRPFGRADE